MKCKDVDILMRIFVIVVTTILICAGITGTSAAVPTLSNSGEGSWQYDKKITIKENLGNTLTDYQILVQLVGSNFPINANPDSSDIRFTGGNWNYCNECGAKV